MFFTELNILTLLKVSHIIQNMSSEKPTNNLDKTNFFACQKKLLMIQ
jgi:hypothetical protein